MSQKLQVLIVEDNPADAELLLHQLRRAGFDLDWRRVDTEADYLANLRPELDLIVSDYSMPAFSALRALALLKGREPNIPFIIVSGTIGEDVAVGAMKMGATDYLLKDRLTRLGPAVTRVLEQKQLTEDRQQAEQKLLEAERRFREMLENLELIAVTLDTRGRVTFCNDYLLDLTGWERREVMGADWFEKFIPDKAAETKSKFFETINSGSLPHHFENSIKTRQGGLRLIRWNNTLLRDGSGNIVGTAGIGEDVTERKEAETALRQNEEWFRSLIENASDLITVVNAEGVVQFQSPSAERVLGFKAEEITGRSAFGFVHLEDMARLESALKRAILDPATPVSVEFRFRHRDGKWRTIQSLGRSLPTYTAGNLVVFNSRDLTEQKTLEEQLRRSQKMEAFGQLAGGVAHDFNNLLTVISGHSELLLMMLAADNPARESLGEIRKAGERAASLTRQLLAFSRQQVLEPRVVDLNTIVTDTKKMLRRLIGEDITLEATLRPDISPVKTDPGQIDQVIMNLVVNARDAMPRGGKLTIETQNVKLDEVYAKSRPDVRPGRYVMLAVSDNGCGMSPEVQAHIFEPFFTTKGVGKGTGLGLAVVHGIVKQSEGHIAVYSEVGIGTTFKIYLPAVDEEPTKTSDPIVTKRVEGSETVLLVEDEDAVRQFTAIALQRFGYKVLKASSGKDALEIIAEPNRPGKIDLLVTDLVMPEMSGRELAEVFEIRFPGIKVLYLSGYTDDAVVRHGILKAGVAFLQKPFTPNSLARKVREVLDRR